MGYYCTVPQCTSLAGKTKNVKFHRFPRDTTMADKWNVILKRGKPYTKYSKVCSLHFTQDDYNVTTMGQWKTLSKDAVPSQNLPKLNADGSVMVIRKTRTVKYRDGKTEVTTVTEKAAEERQKWVLPTQHVPLSTSLPVPDRPATLSNRPELQDVNLAYRVSSQTLSQLVGSISAPQMATISPLPKPKKQDAIMQTDPLSEEDDTQNSGYDNPETYLPKTYDGPKDYTKTEDDYIPQTNEEYNSEAEKYALERKSLSAYEKSYDKNPEYQQKLDMYQYEKYPNRTEWYSNSDSVELLRNQQQNMQILQEQHRITVNQNFFNENHIKQEIDISADEEKYSYERSKGQIGANSIVRYDDQRRLMDHIQHQVKQEPETSPETQSAVNSDLIMQPQGSPYHTTTRHNNLTSGYYDQVPRQPGPELLIMKQNALAAQTHLWQNTMKRPFFYSDSSHYNSSQLLHRCEDYSRILQ